MAEAMEGPIEANQARLERFLDSYPEQFGNEFNVWLHNYAKGELKPEDVIEAMETKVRAALASVDGILGRSSQEGEEA